MEQKHIDRFWSHVERKGPDECWEWTASCASNGYGNAYDRGVISAHRMSWEIAFGEVPEGQWVLHKCPVKHNRKCVNPAHLKLGGVKQNARDMVETGGVATGERHGSKTHPESVLRGQTHPFTTLTETDVMSIRRRHSSGEMSRSELAAEYRVGVQCIGAIVRGSTWKHLPVLPGPSRPVMPKAHPVYVAKREATHCPKGHEYTEANTYWQGGGRWRRCRACVARWAREDRQKKLALLIPESDYTILRGGGSIEKQSSPKADS